MRVADSIATEQRKETVISLTLYYRECWTFANTESRLNTNMTEGRSEVTPFPAAVLEHWRPANEAHAKRESDGATQDNQHNQPEGLTR